MTTTLLNSLQTSNETRALTILTAAFADDPMIRWMYPNERQHLERFPQFARAFAGKAMELGTADVSEHHPAAALWLGPGVEPDEAAVVEILQRSVNPARLSAMFSILEQVSRFHPPEPHWYLPMIGVEPTGQGRGAGSVLLRKGLARCDRDGLPACLEATSSRSVPLYERFGFKAVGQIQAGTSPVIIPMIRPPSPLQ
jgi:ribosomal protein S18 acetylase RimI-like enzyme